MRVDVYWNLHKKCWSVRHKGIVIKHADSVFVKDAKFVVQPAGNRKVRKTKRKTVHAFVRGELSDTLSSSIQIDDLQRVRYNPYKHKTFVKAESNIPIYSASEVLLDMQGACWSNIGGDNEGIVSR